MSSTTHHRRLLPRQLRVSERSSATPTAGGEAVSTAAVSTTAARVLAVVRIAFGLTFLWAFFDKLLALGFATGRNPDTDAVDRFGNAAWINGGSPTKGFLAFGADGPFKDLYNSIAGDAWVDWLFMIGLLGIGLALTLGVGMRIAAAAGALLYLMMWTVALPPANNPVLDEHILGGLTLVALGLLGAGDTWGLGRWWSRTPAVTAYPVLR